MAESSPRNSAGSVLLGDLGVGSRTAGPAEDDDDDDDGLAKLLGRRKVLVGVMMLAVASPSTEALLAESLE